jgi:hypothetical protein
MVMLYQGNLHVSPCIAHIYRCLRMSETRYLPDPITIELLAQLGLQKKYNTTVALISKQMRIVISLTLITLMAGLKQRSAK